MVPENGQRKVLENTRFQNNALAADSKFNIKQGHRRRHPNRVLHQFSGISETTSSATTQWEEAMLYETKRTELPKEYTPKGDTEGLTNQLGIANVSTKNFKDVHKKNRLGKLQRMHLVGV